jgi:hypothetical protein
MGTVEETKQRKSPFYIIAPQIESSFAKGFAALVTYTARDLLVFADYKKTAQKRHRYGKLPVGNKK